MDPLLFENLFLGSIAVSIYSYPFLRFSIEKAENKYGHIPFSLRKSATITSGGWLSFLIFGHGLKDSNVFDGSSLIPIFLSIGFSIVCLFVLLKRVLKIGTSNSLAILSYFILTWPLGICAVYGVWFFAMHS